MVRSSEPEQTAGGARRPPRQQGAAHRQSHPQKALSLLSATLESTADGILVVDRKGNITAHNRKFLSLWRIPEPVARRADARQVLAAVLDQLKDPAAFMKKVEALYSHPGEEGFDTLEVRDGRIFECYAKPQRVAEEIVGRVWTFRDVSMFMQTVEEQCRQRETAERLAEEMAIIAEIGRLIGSTLDIREVYGTVAAQTSKLIPFDRLSVNLHNPCEGTTTVVYVSGMDIPERQTGDSFPLRGSVSEALIGTRTGILSWPSDADAATGRFPALSHNVRAGMRSMMSVPLIFRDAVIGTLHFRALKPDTYTPQDLRLAERIGEQIAGAIATAQLFKECKRTEASLRESEGRYRAIVDRAAVGVAEIEMETGRFLSVNRWLCELVGLTEKEMLATDFHAITHPEDQYVHVDKLRDLAQGTVNHCTLEKRYLRKDGTVIWVNLMISPLWEPGEKPTRNLIVVQDITERKRMEEEIREMSLRDPLTELYNRRGFITLAQQQLKAANRANQQMHLAFLDVDDLKAINDTLGHEEGDRALIHAARIIRNTYRESDIIARLGGDEFAVLAINTDMDPAIISRRLQQHIDAFNAEGTRRYKLAMSQGSAIYDPATPVTLDQLMSSADAVMYVRKKARTRLASPIKE